VIELLKIPVIWRKFQESLHYFSKWISYK